jgi:hypothetical protein
MLFTKIMRVGLKSYKGLVTRRICSTSLLQLMAFGLADTKVVLLFFDKVRIY